MAAAIPAAGQEIIDDILLLMPERRAQMTATKPASSTVEHKGQRLLLLKDRTQMAAATPFARQENIYDSCYLCCRTRQYR